VSLPLHRTQTHFQGYHHQDSAQAQALLQLDEGHVQLYNLLFKLSNLFARLGNCGGRASAHGEAENYGYWSVYVFVGKHKHVCDCSEPAAYNHKLAPFLRLADIVI
jgi:hypothetical protein